MPTLYQVSNYRKTNQPGRPVELSKQELLSDTSPLSQAAEFWPQLENEATIKYQSHLLPLLVSRPHLRKVKPVEQVQEGLAFNKTNPKAPPGNLKPLSAFVPFAISQNRPILTWKIILRHSPYCIQQIMNNLDSCFSWNCQVFYKQ